MRKNEATSRVRRVLGSCFQAQNCWLLDDMHILCSSRMNGEGMVLQVRKNSATCSVAPEVAGLAPTTKKMR